MFKGRHFDRSAILLCVRWYLAYNLSLRDLEEMMAERGLSVDHSTAHRWVVHFSPSCSSVSITASAPSPASGTSTRPISKSGVSGCICTEPSTAAVIRLSSIS